MKFLTGQQGTVDPEKKTVINPATLTVNPAIGDPVWACWESLPTMTMPQRGAAPVKRLVALAQALSSDGLRERALAELAREMHAVLDGYRVRFAKQVESAIEEVWAVRGQTITGGMRGSKLTYTDFVERADERAIRVAFNDAKKAFGGYIAATYVNHLAGPDDPDADGGLREAHVAASALAYVPEVRARVDREADELAETWFAEHRVGILGLNDERKQAYEDIRALATEPRRGQLQRPRTRIEDYDTIDDSGQIGKAPLVDRHLMADAEGLCPIGGLNEWEQSVVTAELGRGNCVGWYRNPARVSVDSLAVSYRDEFGNWRSMHPDFIFFNEVDGQVRPSIVDPHGHHLSDSLVKLKGLASFARQYGSEFHRIEAVSKLGQVMKVLDLQIPAVRDAILAGKRTPMEFYASDIAVQYVGPAF